MTKKLAIISGYGQGLGESLAKHLVSQEYQVVGLSRRTRKTSSSKVISLACDVSDTKNVAEAFTHIRELYGSPDLLIHNAATLLLDDFLNISADDFEQIWRTTCLSAFLITKEVLPAMLEKQRGTLIFSGASASVKASDKSSAFGSAKFALRGLAQSLARAYGPEGIHVIHTIIDGVIWGERAEKTFNMSVDGCMQHDDIAENYLNILSQKPSSWTHEIDMRPFKGVF